MADTVELKKDLWKKLADSPFVMIGLMVTGQPFGIAKVDTVSARVEAAEPASRAS